jgi:hypothetical protein
VKARDDELDLSPPATIDYRLSGKAAQYHPNVGSKAAASDAQTETIGQHQGIGQEYSDDHSCICGHLFFVFKKKKLGPQVK